MGLAKKRHLKTCSFNLATLYDIDLFSRFFAKPVLTVHTFIRFVTVSSLPLSSVMQLRESCVK